MKRQNFFDNLNVLFSDDDENDYAFTKAIIYKNVDTGEIESVQIMNTEYREFLIVDREGTVSIVNMDESEEAGLLGKKGAKKKKKKRKNQK